MKEEEERKKVADEVEYNLAAFPSHSPVWRAIKAMLELDRDLHNELRRHAHMPELTKQQHHAGFITIVRSPRAD